MVLLEVDPNRFSVLPFKRDAPGSVYVQRITSRFPAQWVEVEPWDVQFQQRFSLVQRVEAADAPSVQLSTDSAAAALLEQLSKALVPKADDHCSKCNTL